MKRIFHQEYDNNISVDIHKKSVKDFGLDYKFSVYLNGKLFTTRRGMEIKEFNKYLNFIRNFTIQEHTYKKEIDLIFPIGQELYFEYDEEMCVGHVVGYEVDDQEVNYFKIKTKVGSIHRLYPEDKNKTWFYDKDAATLYANSHNLYSGIR